MNEDLPHFYLKNDKTYRLAPKPYLETYRNSLGWNLVIINRNSCVRVKKVAQANSMNPWICHTDQQKAARFESDFSVSCASYIARQFTQRHFFGPQNFANDTVPLEHPSNHIEICNFNILASSFAFWGEHHLDFLQKMTKSVLEVNVCFKNTLQHNDMLSEVCWRQKL